MKKHEKQWLTTAKHTGVNVVAISPMSFDDTLKSAKGLAGASTAHTYEK